MSRAPTDAGFSLVEALVALAVFAMAGAGLVQLQAHSLRTLSAVETRALADMVAQNALVDVLASAIAPQPGADTETLSFAGRSWQRDILIAGSGEPGTLRVSVTVRAEGEAQPAAVAHAFAQSGARP